MAAIGTRKLKLEIDDTEYNAEITTAKVTSAESDNDTLTFAEAAANGGRDYALVLTLLQDAAAGTLWTEIFTNAGTDVPYTFIPYGNAVPSASEPHFTGTCTISEPDGDLLGTEANRSSTARATIEVTFPCTGKPTKVTTP